VKLKFYLPYTWASLAVLNGLISHPTQVEYIRIDELGHAGCHPRVR